MNNPDFNTQQRKSSPDSLSFSLTPVNNDQLAAVLGERGKHLHQIETDLDVEITHRGELFYVQGAHKDIQEAKRVLKHLYQQAADSNMAIDSEQVHLALVEKPSRREPYNSFVIKVRKTQVRPKNDAQEQYLRQILSNDVVFGIGPAGTGKTYLAVACAAQALAMNEVERIVLVRPAVEAGEKLGFLPGDIGQKVDPYLRPLYDALYEMLGFDRVARLIERGIIELAPLAYMRGRTLSESFVLLDEAQNTTAEQMKMFLTRLGYGSKMVITGDVTQIDLPGSIRSGLVQVQGILRDVKDVQFTHFSAKHVVRHSLVQRIVDAYDRHGNGDPQKQSNKQANNQSVKQGVNREQA